MNGRHIYTVPHSGRRAIRLFTSKIADSAAEGVNLVGDKAFAEEVPAPVETVAEEAAPAEAEVVDMEAALGGGIRKAPAAVAVIHYVLLAPGWGQSLTGIP